MKTSRIMPEVTAMTADMPVCAAGDSPVGMERRTFNPRVVGSSPTGPTGHDLQFRRRGIRVRRGISTAVSTVKPVVGGLEGAAGGHGRMYGNAADFRGFSCGSGPHCRRERCAKKRLLRASLGYGLEPAARPPYEGSQWPCHSSRPSEPDDQAGTRRYPASHRRTRTLRNPCRPTSLRANSRGGRPSSSI